jgi:NADH:ubiquinone oxidoreductase subunit 6 (subunit J)
MSSNPNLITKIGQLFIQQIQNDPIFFVISSIVLLTALAVVVQKNLVRAGFTLIGCFGAIALLYFVLGAELVAASQILIYAVGITLVVIFAIMLLTGSMDNAEEPKEIIESQFQSFFRPLATFLIPFSLFLTMAISFIGLAYYPPFRLRVKDFVGYAQIQKDYLGATSNPSIVEIGNRMLSEQLLPFELISILLLIAFVASIAIARKTEVKSAAAVA